jgi:hypothetical protein
VVSEEINPLGITRVTSAGVDDTMRSSQNSRWRDKTAATAKQILAGFRTFSPDIDQKGTLGSILLG